MPPLNQGSWGKQSREESSRQKTEWKKAQNSKKARYIGALKVAAYVCSRVYKGRNGENQGRKRRRNPD